MDRTVDVAIVGGGVIGLMAAYELLRAGATVTLFERGEPGKQASWAGAGIIAPGRPDGAATPEDRLRAESAARFPELSAELTEQTGLLSGYWKSGGCEHIATPDDVAAWTREGIVFEVMPDGAYFFPDMAQVRNPWFLRALAEAVTKLGGVIHSHMPVRGWQRVRARIVAARTEQGAVSADEYLLCGGAWSDELLGPIGVRLGVKPVRGQIVLYHLIEGGPPHIHVWDKKYLVPRGDGHILVGSTEEEAGFDATVTAMGIGELRRFAEKHWPALENAAVVSAWAGLRPGSADGRPTIGRVTGFENLTVAAGHFRSGIQLSPATGRLVAEVITGREPFIPLDPFQVGRPAAPPMRPVFRS